MKLFQVMIAVVFASTASEAFALDRDRVSKKISPGFWSTDEGDVCSGYANWAFKMGTETNVRAVNESYAEYLKASKTLWDKIASIDHNVSVEEYASRYLAANVALFERQDPETLDHYKVFCVARLRQHVNEGTKSKSPN